MGQLGSKILAVVTLPKIPHIDVDPNLANYMNANDARMVRIEAAIEKMHAELMAAIASLNQQEMIESEPSIIESDSVTDQHQQEIQAPIDDDLGEHYFKDFIVTAPVAGQLVKRLVDRGMMVKKGQPMFIMKSEGPGQPEVVVKARMDGTVFVLPLKDGNNLDSYQALFYLYDFQKHKERAMSYEALEAKDLSSSG